MSIQKKIVGALLLAAFLAACNQQPALDEQPLPATIEDLPVLETLSIAPDNAQTRGAPGYNITLNIIPGTPQSVRNALSSAVSRWQRAITGDLPDVTGTIPANSCGNNPAFSGTIDDLLVFSGSQSIDGAGGTLAQSGPCFVRTANGLTIASVLIFDSADLTQFASQLSAIAVHELGHSVGIGTLWSSKGLLRGAGTTNPRFVGAGAVREWRALGGSGSVPVENTGGPGTRDGHWRESVFNNELMTGFINAGTNPLSRMSIASLSDLGYGVNLNAADAYSLPTNRAAIEAFELNEQLIMPSARVR
ncbi:MAG: peptidase [Pleurocapsa sp. SU_196_0]|nr:peptidase [Pleurocapsa sp. SU_196_0]